MSELMHYKYTKKYYKNGRWRYTYKYGGHNPIHMIGDKLGLDEKETLKKAKKDLGFDREFYMQMAQSKMNPKYSAENTQKVINRSMNGQRENLKASRARVKFWTERYNKTPLGKIEKAAKKGKRFLKRLFG